MNPFQIGIHQYRQTDNHKKTKFIPICKVKYNKPERGIYRLGHTVKNIAIKSLLKAYQENPSTLAALINVLNETNAKTDKYAVAII